MVTNEIPVDAIGGFYGGYSAKDIAESLFTSSLWLPNIASPARHLLATCILLTLKPEDFSKEDKIKSYSDFEKFLNNLFAIIPSFSFEDFVPELDWGEIRFHHNRDYRILYGGEIEYSYDYLKLFQTFYSSLNEKIIEVIGQDPLEDFENTLLLQERIISNIDDQCSAEKTKETIKPGYFETPTEQFWKSALNCIRNYNISDQFSQSFLDQYSVKPDEIKREVLGKKFEELFFSGNLLQSFFIKINDGFTPILPRRYNSILLFHWKNLIEKNYLDLFQDYKKYVKEFGWVLNDYFDSRIPNLSKFHFVSALNKDTTPDGVVFSSAFISKTKLILLYLAQPTNTKVNLEADLKRIQGQLQRAKDLVFAVPLTIGWHTEGKTVVFDAKEDGSHLEPLIIVLLPILAPVTAIYEIPESFPAKIIFLHQFLGIVDEMDDCDQFASFYDYLEEYADFMAPSDLFDIFASFKLSDSILIKGATKPNLILLEPHMASNERFRTLSNFWKLFPKTTLFCDPREWRVEKEHENAVRLTSRTKFRSIISCSVGITRFFITTPFEMQNQKQIQFSNLLMECLEDSLQKRKSFIETHAFFKKFDELRILFFPDELIKKSVDFPYLRHLDASNAKWVSDIGFIKTGLPCIRCVYNEDAVFETFQKTEDSSEEVSLLLEVMSKLNQIEKDENYSKIENDIIGTKATKPRFKTFWVERKAAFPEIAQFYEPGEAHSKLTNRKIAELAKEIKLDPGYYEIDQAKCIVNLLRDRVVREIDRIISEYDFNSNIPFLLTQLDSLTNNFERIRSTIDLSMEHQVDYDRQERYSNELIEYVSLHRCGRYLIEKFVQLSPKSQLSLEPEQYKYLIELIGRLYTLYQTSDNLHYGIFPLGVNVTEDYLFEVKYLEDINKKQESFFKEKAEIRMGTKGKPSDRLKSPNPIEEFLEKMDLAFKQDLKFSYRDMINMLQVLSFWANYTQTDISSYYSSEVDKIIETCSKNIIGYDQNSGINILDFLTLKPDQVTRVLGQQEPCRDIPVWEHNKRYSRYTTKPLILINGKYYWGPYSVMKTGTLWCDQLINARLPFDLQGKNIQQVIDNEKRLLDMELEKKAFDIVKRFTIHTEQNVELHKRDKKGNHPAELGDYDVLSFHPDKNKILNIECKNLSQEYCLKDLQRLKKKIFEDYLVKFNRRQKYLANNCKRVMTALGWVLDADSNPQIINIFLIPESYWWTKYPPIKTTTVFISIDLLSDYIQRLPN